jgi:hypothetical protein
VRIFFQERYRVLRSTGRKNLMPLLLQVGLGKNSNLLLVLDE